MVTGLTIQQYLLNKKRIGLAQKYLKEGRFLTDVCWMSGFNNYSHFARTFSQQVGVSPKSIRTILCPCRKTQIFRNLFPYVNPE